MLGEITVPIMLSGRIFEEEFWVTDRISTVVLGYEFMKTHKFNWTVGGDEVWAEGTCIPLVTRYVTSRCQKMETQYNVPVPSTATCTQDRHCHVRRDRVLSVTDPGGSRRRRQTARVVDVRSAVRSCSRPEREVVGRKEKERRRLAELQGRVAAERREAARVAAEEAKQAAQRRKEQRMKVTAACTDKYAGRSVRPAQQSREADRDLMTRKKFACYTVPVQEPCTAKSSEIPSAADEFGWSWLWESGGQDVVQDA